MKPAREDERNFLRFYLDPELFTNDEAEEVLRELGINTDEIKEKGEKLIKKLEAQRTLRRAAQKKEEFLEILDQFKKEKTEQEFTDDGDYRKAARKQTELNGDNPGGEMDDAKLLEYLKKKKH
jgi:hypothetical protein